MFDDMRTSCRKWENSLEFIDGERKVQIGQMEVARLTRKMIILVKPK